MLEQRNQSTPNKAASFLPSLLSLSALLRKEGGGEERREREGRKEGERKRQRKRGYGRSRGGGGRNKEREGQEGERENEYCFGAGILLKGLI